MLLFFYKYIDENCILKEKKKERIRKKERKKE